MRLPPFLRTALARIVTWSLRQSQAKSIVGHARGKSEQRRCVIVVVEEVCLSIHLLVAVDQMCFAFMLLHTVTFRRSSQSKWNIWHDLQGSVIYNYISDQCELWVHGDSREMCRCPTGHWKVQTATAAPVRANFFCVRKGSTLHNPQMRWRSLER